MENLKKNIPGIQYIYDVITNGIPMNSKTLEDMGIPHTEIKIY